MLDFFETIEDLTEEEFEERLPHVCLWVSQIVLNGTRSEIGSIAEYILTIKDPIKYVRVVEQLFITDQRLYLKLVNEGNVEIAKRRKEIAG